MKIIKWTQITRDNIPSEEVLGINDVNDIITGFIMVTGDDEYWIVNGYEEMEDATHFILLSDLVKLKEI